MLSVLYDLSTVSECSDDLFWCQYGQCLSVYHENVCSNMYCLGIDAGHDYAFTLKPCVQARNMLLMMVGIIASGKPSALHRLLDVSTYLVLCIDLHLEQLMMRYSSTQRNILP